MGRLVLPEHFKQHHLREGGDPGNGSTKLFGPALRNRRMDLPRQSLRSCRIKSGMTFC